MTFTVRQRRDPYKQIAERPVRTCAEGCGTFLSIYNPSDTCSLHTVVVHERRETTT